MTPSNSGYFLLLDSSSEAVTSKLTTTETEHRGKHLLSGEANWLEITRLAKSRNCLGVIAVFRESTYRRLASDIEVDSGKNSATLGSIDQGVIDGLLKAIAAQPHLVLAHEAVLGGAAIYEGLEDQGEDEPSLYGEGSEWSDEVAREHFGDIDERVRVRANERIAAVGINVTPYRRNADSSMLSLTFIEDQQSNLLFRLYVPAGRLFENESADLLRLFHDWLTAVRGKNIRQGGYTTARGRVIEFFAENRSVASELQGEVHRFQEFLSLVEQPVEAAALLVGLGVTKQRADSIVSRYATQARRLQIDIKHERERRSLAIRQELESELIDEAPQLSGAGIAQLVDHLLPDGPLLLQGPHAKEIAAAPIMVFNQPVINQQIVNRAEGIVAQHIAGDAIHGIQATELERLISTHGAAVEQGELLNALREFLDSSAPHQGRLVAKQKLKAFLIAIGGKAGQVGVNLLQKWLEQQMGL